MGHPQTLAQGHTKSKQSMVKNVARGAAQQRRKQQHCHRASACMCGGQVEILFKLMQPASTCCSCKPLVCQLQFSASSSPPLWRPYLLQCSLLIGQPLSARASDLRPVLSTPSAGICAAAFLLVLLQGSFALAWGLGVGCMAFWELCLSAAYIASRKLYPSIYSPSIAMRFREDFCCLAAHALM